MCFARYLRFYTSNLIKIVQRMEKKSKKSYRFEVVKCMSLIFEAKDHVIICFQYILPVNTFERFKIKR